MTNENYNPLGNELFNEMNRSILPVAAEISEGKMKGVGSCTLIATDDYHHFIVTAAHVLRDWRECKLFIVTETKLIEITWPFKMTEKGKSDCDHTLDIAYSLISPELKAVLSENHISIMTDGFNSNSVKFDTEILFAFGYPASKIIFDNRKKEFEINPFQYFGQEINDSKLF